MSTLAVYPGTFDPLTLGHVDLVQRAARLFDHVIIAVSRSTWKAPLFTLPERMAMVRRLVAPMPNVQVDSFDGLLVHYVRSKRARVIVRGLRAFSDFEYEYQMALTNRKLDPQIETLFLMPKEVYSYLSSSMVREIAELGGNISDFAPDYVAKALKKKCAKKSVSSRKSSRKN